MHTYQRHRFIVFSGLMLSIPCGLVTSYLCIGIYTTFFPVIGHIETLLGTSLPSNASNVQGQYIPGFQYVDFYLRFSIPSQEFAGFIEKICETGSQGLTSKYNWHGSPHSESWPDWWLPTNTPIAVSGLCFPRGTYVEIFVDESNPALYTLYLYGGLS